MGTATISCSPCCGGVACSPSACRCNDVENFNTCYTFTITGVTNGDCSCCNNYNRTVVLKYVGTDNGNCVWEEDVGVPGCNGGCVGNLTKWKLFRDTSQSVQPYWALQSQPDGITYVINQPGFQFGFGYPAGFFAPGTPQSNPIAPPTTLCKGFPGLAFLTPFPVGSNPCFPPTTPNTAVDSPCIYANCCGPAAFDPVIYSKYRVSVSGFVNGTSSCCADYNGTFDLSMTQNVSYGCTYLSALLPAIGTCPSLIGRFVLTRSGNVTLQISNTCFRQTYTYRFTPGFLSGPGPWTLDRFNMDLPDTCCSQVPSTILLEGVGSPLVCGVCSDSTVAPPRTLQATVMNTGTGASTTYPIQYGLIANGLPPCFSYWMGSPTVPGFPGISIYFFCNEVPPANFFVTPPTLYIELAEDCELITNNRNDCFHPIPGSTPISYTASPFFAAITIGSFKVTITE